MEIVTKEDVFIMITSFAVKKMIFLFPDVDVFSNDTDDYETYTTEDGKEYGKWDVPVFIVLNGLARKLSIPEIVLACVQKLCEHGFSVDCDKINGIIQTANEKCESEINAIIEADWRFEQGDNPIEIFNEIKWSLISEDNYY